MKVKLAEMFTVVHKSVEVEAETYYEELRRRVYITPKSYLDGITLYLSKLEAKKREEGENISRLGNGCRKLKETNDQIEGLQISLAALLPKLVEENAKAEVKAIEIKDNKYIAFQKESIVEQESAYV